MTRLLSNLVNNLSETCGIIYEVSDCFLDYANFKVDVIEYNCLRCNKNYQRKFDENLKNDFFNTYKFSNHTNNKFILLLRKGNISLYLSMCKR